MEITVEILLSVVRSHFTCSKMGIGGRCDIAMVSNCTSSKATDV
jgi:hypothetical protein